MAYVPALASLATGIIGSALAGKAPTLPYTGNAVSNLTGESTAGTALTNAGAQALGQYNAFTPTESGAVTNDLNLLNSNPYTDSFSAAQLANATNGVQADYGGAQAQLAQQLQARGLGGDGSGGVNSTAAGGLTAIDLGKAQTLGTARNQLAMNAVQQRYANLAQAAQLAQQYGGTLFNQGVGATATGAGILGNAASGFMNLGQAQQQENNTYSQQAGGLGSSLGFLAAGGVPGGAGGIPGIGGTGIPGIGGSSPTYQDATTQNAGMYQSLGL